MRKYLFLLTFLMILTGCYSYRGASLTEPALQYMNNQGDGSITVRVSSTGRNRSDAMAQARKYALRQAIFNGIQVPDNTLLSKPLVTEVNAEEKYQQFFDSFFADGGDYTKFVSSKDKRAGSAGRSRNKVSVRAITTVRVLRSELNEYLIQNNIVKQ